MAKDDMTNELLSRIAVALEKLAELKQKEMERG